MINLLLLNSNDRAYLSPTQGGDSTSSTLFGVIMELSLLTHNGNLINWPLNYFQKDFAFTAWHIFHQNNIISYLHIILSERKVGVSLLILWIAPFGTY